jgi:hypothetical protein
LLIFALQLIIGQFLMKLQVLKTTEEFARIDQDWERLARYETPSFPHFNDIHDFTLTSGQRVSLIVAGDENGIQAIACFIHSKTRRGFWLFNRRLFDLPVHETVLQGSAILGAPSPGLAAGMLDRILAEPGVALVKLGYVDKSTASITPSRRSPANG